MGHLIRLLPRTTRTRNLLLALSISLIGVVSLSAQQPRLSPSAAPTAQPVTPAPSASPSVVPSATAFSPTPIATATTAVTPSIPANTPTAAPTTNTTQSDNLRGIFQWGDFKFEGPIWFVLIGLIAVLVVTVVLPARVVSQVKDKWSFSAKTWIIILLIGIGVFFILGLLLGVRRSQPTGSRTSQPLAQFPDLRPTPSPSPSPSPTVPPTVSSTVSPASPTSSAIGPPTQSPSPSPSPTPSPTPFELSVSEVRVEADDEVAGLGDNIVLTIKNLKEELARQLAPNTERIEPRKYVLFLDDMEVKKLHPIAFDPNAGALTFKLNRTAESKEVWTNLLAAQKSSTRQTKASVGPEGKPPLPSDQTFTLSIYRRAWLNLGIIGFILAIGLFVWLARNTSIIRDSGPPEPPQNSFRPFSLARAQVAWWLFIILGSFLFIALVTQDFDTITSSSLILLGIGTGAALGAAMVDANKRESVNSALLTLKPQQASLAETVSQLRAQVNELEAKRTASKGDLTESELMALNAAKQNLTTKEAELVQVDRQVSDAASALTKPVSEGFFEDILSDVNGVTFHRFQMVVWTIILGIIFGWSVWKRLAMPEFSDTLLALMGISAGTYLGFKFPERQTAPGPQLPSATSQPTVKPPQPPAQPQQPPAQPQQPPAQPPPT